MIRKISGSVLLVLALVLAVSCGQDAKKAIDEAQLALNQAKDAEAPEYAADEYTSAESLLAKARDEYASRDYKPSQTDAVSAREQAELAKKRALDRKAEQAQKPGTESSLAYNVPSIGEEDIPLEDQARAALKDVNFEFDSAELDDWAKQILVNNAKWLQDHPEVKVQVEGHCDERGTEDYNLALGQKRAKAVRDYLVSLGIGQSRLSIISYGEAMPLDSGSSEDSWAKNRRAHFAIRK